MKKITHSNNGLAVFCLLTLMFFFTGCQEEDITNRNGDLETTTSLLRSGDCEVDCIVEGGPYFDTQDTKTVTWGGRYQNNNSKTIDIKYYNTTTHFVIEVKSTNGWSDLLINDVSVWPYGQVAANTWGVYSYPLADGWQACDLINFNLKVAGNGPPATFDVNYNLIGICDDGCETSFTGEAIYCGAAREAVYTFTADADQDYIKIQGGLTNFTGENAVVWVSNENLDVSQSTPGGSSNRIIKVEGPVSECETIIIRITWNSSSTGGIITGDWSVKNGNGLELAPSVPGLQCD